MINAPWGVRGHVKVTPLTDHLDRFATGTTVLVNGQPRRITDLRTPQGYPILLFEGVGSMDEAEQLRNATIEIDEADLADLPEDEFYVHDLIGLAVVTAEGEAIGTIQDVLRTGSNDVYVVRRAGRPDVLIPVIHGVVGDVDMEARTVTVTPVPGLFD